MEITENSNSSSIYSSEQLGIASFAVYLKPGDDSFVNRLMEESEEQEAAAVPIIHPCNKVVPKLSDGEIGVFGAEKYFNMTLPNTNIHASSSSSTSTSKRQQLSDAVAVAVTVDGRNTNNKDNPYYSSSSSMVRRGTPSVRSHSSWTSTQSSSTFLLKRNKLGSRAERRGGGGGFFAGGLSCYKSCNDTKSIYTVAPQQQVLSEKSSSRGTGSSKRMIDQQQFTFPVMTSSAPIDESRPSLEVFGSKPPKAAAAGGGQNKNDIVAVNLERKLSVLTWDAIPTTTTTSSSSLIIADKEDMASEASSDLFEIDTISGAGSMAPSMYPPSEASIEWSVVTASAADFSDYDIHPHFNLIPSASRNAHRSNLREAPKGRRRQTGLLGCNNHKAVQVAQTTTKTNTAATAAASSPQLKRLQVIGLTTKE